MQGIQLLAHLGTQGRGTQGGPHGSGHLGCFPSSASEQAVLLCFVVVFATESVGRFKSSCSVNGSEIEEWM